MKHIVVPGFLLAAACSGPNDPAATASTDATRVAGAPALAAKPAGPPPADLAGRLDCLRSSGGVLLIGHRGGPTQDYPENALETLERTYAAGVRAMEVDIASTKDNVLMLMHDDELDRGTTGKGLVADHSWAEIGQLKLKTHSKETDFHPVRLADVLAWAVSKGATLELDKKKSASWGPIVAAVRTGKAENNVFLITYTDDQAIDLHKLAPDLVITAIVESPSQLDNLLAKGVKSDHLIAWTGTTKPDPAIWKTAAGHGVESAFGTLGPRATSLDGKYWDDGDGSEYDKLVSDGLPILVTDLTDKVSRRLSAGVKRASTCGF